MTENVLEHHFRLKEYGTTVRREVVGGLGYSWQTVFGAVAGTTTRVPSSSQRPASRRAAGPARPHFVVAALFALCLLFFIFYPC